MHGQVSQVYWFYVFVNMLPAPQQQQLTTPYPILPALVVPVAEHEECHLSVVVTDAAIPKGISKVKVSSLRTPVWLVLLLELPILKKNCPVECCMQQQSHFCLQAPFPRGAADHD